MKKRNKILTLVLAGVFMLFPVTKTAAITEFDSTTRVVYGSGLSEAQQGQTLDLMNLASTDGASYGVVNGADIERYLGQSGVADSSMISSVAVVGNDDKGVRVQVATEANITSVKDHQYANAAITAGISNVDIVVAAVSPVTGESALTGVYKAAEMAGVELDEDKLKAGQDELEAVVDISEGKTDEEKKSLSDAIVEIKNQISDSVIQQGNNNISTGDITVIMNNVFENFNITLTEDQINRLAEIFQNFASSLTTEEANLIKDQLQSFGEQAQDFFAEAEASGLWDKIVDFFRNIAEWFQSLFS